MFVLLSMALLLSSTLASINRTSPFPLSLCSGVDIRDISTETLQEHFSNGRLTYFQLSKCYVDRITLTNPFLHHVIEINPDWHQSPALLTMRDLKASFADLYMVFQS